MWPFLRREKRDSSYTDALVSAILKTAGGDTLAVPAATAAAQTAAGVVSRAFSAAEVQHAGPAANALTAAYMGLLGRDLILRGEHVSLLDVPNGSLALHPAGTWDIVGSYDPTTWTYRLDLHGPSETHAHRVGANEVIHVRNAYDPARPWHGVGPLQAASAAATLAANVAHVLGNETSMPVGAVIPTPKDGSDDTLDDLKAEIGKMTGQVFVVESMSQNWQGGGMAPADWQQKRIGPTPPRELVDLHEQACRQLLNCYGLSAAIFSESQGTAAREAWRQALHGVIMPLARIVQEELREKLDQPSLSISFDALQASDISGRARAFQSMVGGGMDVSKAAALAGLMEAE